MQYADFEYYKTEFHGTVIASAAEFDSMEIKARAYVDTVTFGRAASAAESSEVKNATCAICEIYQQYSKHEGISSENNDGYSVTYLSNSRLLTGRLAQAAKVFLPAKLRYRGWDE